MITLKIHIITSRRLKQESQFCVILGFSLIRVNHLFRTHLSVRKLIVKLHNINIPILNNVLTHKRKFVVKMHSRKW